MFTDLLDYEDDSRDPHAEDQILEDWADNAQESD